MKNVLLIVIFLFVSICISGSRKDSIVELQQQIAHQEHVVNKMQRKIGEYRLIYEKHGLIIDSLQKGLLSTQNEIQLLSKKTERDAVRTQEQLNESTKTFFTSIKLRTVYGIIVVFCLLLLISVLYVLLHRGHTNVVALKQKADKLNEDILHQFSLDMVEMQKIAASLVALSSAQAAQVSSAAPDHSLIKTLADRITFMEMTLYNMDKTVKGHKTLTKAIANMKNNLFANGYELVDMLGKHYHEGMLVNNVDFVDDESLEKGEQIITKIIKPQINYKGQMIQSAQIQVSKNF